MSDIFAHQLLGHCTIDFILNRYATVQPLSTVTELLHFRMRDQRTLTVHTTAGHFVKISAMTSAVLRIKILT